MEVLKKLCSIIMVAVIVLQSTASTISVAHAFNNRSIIGTNAALGSPILDPNFVVEDWNKWEMLTWGIFLSNFAVPLIDDYESAFNSNIKRGSRGAGFKALTFGSGSDMANANTIRGLLDHAITQQRNGRLSPIYVNFSDVSRAGITRREGQEFRAATLKDMFLMSNKEDGDSWVKRERFSGLRSFDTPIVPIEIDTDRESWVAGFGRENRYISIATINEGSLPTFSIKSGGGFETVFDYTNGWDAQILTAWIARVALGEHGEEFATLFNKIWENINNYNLFLDAFGNIVILYEGSRRIIIPASINQHLTESKQINLLSSMIFNGYNSGVSGSELVLSGQQSISGWTWDSQLLGISLDNTDIRFGGLPALGSRIANIPKGLIMMYYDLDTIAYNNHFRGGGLSTGLRDIRRNMSVVERAHGLHYGRAVRELFELDITRPLGNSHMFKIEAANIGNFDMVNIKNGSAREALSNMVNVGGQIVNINGARPNAKVLSEVITTNGRVSLFGDPVIIPVQMDLGRNRNGNRVNSSGVARTFINYLYDVFKNGRDTLAGNITRQHVEALMNMSDSARMSGFRDVLLGTRDGTVPLLLAGFMAERNDLYRLNLDANEVRRATINNRDNQFVGIRDTIIDNRNAADLLFEDSGSLDYFPGRLIKAYPVSEVMRSVGNILGVREGTEFSLFSTFIYMTYLDWYGVRVNRVTGQATSNFNQRIFDSRNDVINVDIESIIDIQTETDKKREVLNFTYMMLHPTKGRIYRNEMMRSYINNFIYDTYQKIVFGNATSFYSNISRNLATRNATGFLNIETYSNNFMTAWFINIYSRIAVFMIAISFILIIVTGLIRSRKLSWYLIAMTVVINTILIIPSVGEITPLVANNMVQNMFRDKMTYWAISESVANAEIERESIDNTNTGFLGTLNDRERSQVIDLVRSLNTLYLDRAIMVRSDISRKVTQTQSGNFAEIQRLRSARWMLPMIMRQFTSNRGSEDYVLIPLGDVYDDMSNMYWFYNPQDAEFAGTVNSRQSSYGGILGASGIATTAAGLSIPERRALFPDYIDTTINSIGTLIPYRSIAYYRGLDPREKPHTFFYMLSTNAVLLPRIVGFNGPFTGRESFVNYVNASIQSGGAQQFLSTALMLEQEAGTYNRFDRSTVRQSFGFLWATENPFHYFYQAIKAKFDSDMTLGMLAGKLQGRYVVNENEKDVRTSFMHSDETGYIRDILDLEEMFTNMIPYLYQMQITTGGFDGRSGVLGDAKIELYDLYSNNYKSWLFRSNWVTKLMESSNLNRPAIVTDLDGNRIEIINPMLIDSYPQNRPMIFSEAQMYALGLSKSDLNIVELKAIEVNNNTSRRWTMLLNYVNVPGITNEVILRQMATEAVLEFNKVFSPKGLFNRSYRLYPDGLDLRAISFDSVMRMLMLNITRDTSYIYGDTMKNIITNSDIFSALLLLTAAFLSTYIIPLIRNITMGLIFYLGFLAIIYTLLSSHMQKIKVSCGYIVSNILFLVITLMYYSVFSALTAMTATDTVLSVQTVQVNVGNPVWSFIVIILVSILYIIALIKMIDFCFKNYRDMGYEVYANITGMVTEKVTNGLEKLSSTGQFNGGEYSERQNTRVRESSNDSINNDATQHNEREKNKADRDYDTTDYSYDNGYLEDSSDTEEIEIEIKKGKE